MRQAVGLHLFFGGFPWALPKAGMKDAFGVQKARKSKG
jgi:hypothetical protein